MTQHTSPFIIPPLDANDDEARIRTGTTVALDDGGVAVYVQAGSEIAQFQAVAIRVDQTVVSLTTAAVAEGTGSTKQVGFAQTSIASGNYGWVQTSGRPKVKLAANCADQVILFTTATEGVLDDATVSASLIAGVVSKTTISNATAITVIVPHGAYVHPFVNPQ
jgi:hypothetical protein